MPLAPRPDSAAPLLKLQLLGGLDIRIGTGAPSESGYAKLRALLVYLALAAGKPLRRDHLATLFWPNMTSSAARQNLRRALFNLKTLLGDASQLLASTTHDVTLATTGLHLDVMEFTREHDFSDAAQMARMAALYRGEFMAGFMLPECPEFEDWLQAQREALHRRALLLLDRLVLCHERNGAHQQALPYALHYAALQPWDEAGQRRAMRLLVQNGQDSAALSHFDAFRKLLKSELGVLPEAETCLLAERIRQGELLPRMAAPLAPGAPPLAERRQVSVLYCELPVALQDDPEETMARLRGPQERCAEIIRRCGGHIVQTHGGSLLAYFGYPQASEDAARHAVQAALELGRAALEGSEASACVHTGLIVTGGDAMPDTAGKTTKLAMQLRHGAAPHRAVISEATQRIVAGYFDCTPLGTHAFPGIAGEVALFAVAGASGARTRLEAAARLTPLAGRQHEIAALMAAWSTATRGTRRLMLVQGEAGIGKSRLLLALQEALRGQPCALPELRCFPEHSQSPFHPFIAMLEALLHCAADDTPPQRFEKLVQYLTAHLPTRVAEAAPLLAALMSLPLREPYRMPAFPPAKLKEMTIALLLEWLCTLAARQPVLMVIEDMHWIDPSSLELLNRFVEEDAPCAVLALGTARPEFVPPWTAHRFTTLPLGQLAAPDVLTMIAALRQDWTPAQVAHIAAHTDGVPLFIEEMARFSAHGEPTGIPATLHDLLAVRMDTLGNARHTAQLAATLGREFRLDWLQRLAPTDDFPARLTALYNSGLVLPAQGATAQFKHALIQQAAYESQTRQDRRAAHQRIARMLQSDEAEIIAKQPELLAQHLAAGGETLPAIEYWMLAGQRAVQLSANAEAIGHFNNGLALLPQLPESTERDRLEAALNLHLGTASIVTQGYGSLQARQAFSRARQLGEQTGDHAITFTAIWGKWLGASSCENYVHAAELADRLFELAQQGNDPIQLQQACLAVGDCHLWRGQPGKACDYFEQGLALYRPEHHAEMVQRVGENVGISIGSQLVWAQWLSGRPAQAAATGRRTLEIAQRLDHPYSLGYIHTHLMILARWNGDLQDMQRHAEQAMTIAQTHGFHIWLVSGLTFLGLARCRAGDEAGLAQIEQGCAIVHTVMSGIEAFFISALGEAQGCLGHYAAALQTLEQALASCREKDNRFWESDILRLQGEYQLRLAPPDLAYATDRFEQALALSRAQHSLALELRAATSLARLWLQQDRIADAHALLSDCIARFPEPAATADLRAATALLASEQVADLGLSW